MEFTIEYDNNPLGGLYRLCVDDIDGPLVGWGDVATVVAEDGHIYYCQMEDPDTFDGAIFRMEPGTFVGEAEVEHVPDIDQGDDDPAEPAPEGVIEMPPGA
jgi:hypothetical protein